MVFVHAGKSLCTGRAIRPAASGGGVDCGGSFFNQLDQFLPGRNVLSCQLDWDCHFCFGVSPDALEKATSHFIDLVFSRSGDCFLFGTGVYSILEMLKKRLQNIVWDASQALSFRNKRIRISGEFGVFVQKTEWKMCISIKKQKSQGKTTNYLDKHYILL